jgi:FKBP-type peptidyl-prolyl cis-trans isomerase
MLISLFVINACGQQSDDKLVIDKNPPPPMTWDDSVSYFIGSTIGESIAADSLNIRYEYYIKGIEDKRQHNKKPLMTDEEVRAFGIKFQRKMVAREAQKRQAEEAKLKKEAAENIVKAKKFLEENKKKPGVIETKSGLQYKILKEGNGKKPEPNDMITFHLRAWNMDGVKFDDSYERKEPITLPLQDGLFPGWLEAFKMMKVGSKWKLWLPPDLAFGEKGLEGQVGPNSVVTFEIELLKIGGKQPPPVNLNQQGMQPPPNMNQ